MDIPKKSLWLAVLFFAACLVSPPAPHAASPDEGIVVGRIAHIEGQVLRYVPDTQDWVATVKDAPFGMEDALYSDSKARAEFIMPNGLWLRIGPSSQVQLIALKADASELDVASGTARFYNKSSEAMLKATTPFGYVLAEPGSTFDLYVGDQSVEVVALSGEVDFIHQTDNARYEVKPGSGSIVADASQVGSGDGNLDAEWDDWNAGRDSLWTKRVQVKGESVKYVPPEIQDDTYALEENGKWETVHYEGEARQVWRPTTVDDSWQPFTAGRWTEWYGDQCWVPDEPFGYVTHHYGNWIVVDRRWYWSPPVRRVAVVAGPSMGLAWYPGRVAWISSGVNVGWVPLAPREVYYSRHHWGHGATILAVGAPAVSINLGGLAFASAAVIVPQTSFYSVSRYNSVRVTNINHTTIINNYRPAPVVNNTVINNYNTINNRHNFTNVNVTRKPHREAVTRIQENRKIATRQAPTVNAVSLKQNLATTKRVETVKPITVAPPKVTSKIVPAAQVNAPKSQVKFQPAEVKKSTKPASSSSVVQTQGQKGLRPGAPGAQPGQVTPPAGQKPGGPGVQQPAKPGEQPQRPGVQPVKPSEQPTRPGVQPAKPGEQPTKPGVQPPTRPGERERPGIQPTRPGEQPARPGVQPTKPGEQPTRPGVQPPTRPGERERPGIQPTRPGEQPARPGVQPTKPGEQPTRPGVQPPTRPGERERPGIQPTRPGEQPARPGVQPTKPGEQPTKPGVQPPTRPGERERPGIQPTRPGEQPARPGVQPTKPGEQPAKPGVQPSTRPSEQRDRPSERFTPGRTPESSGMRTPPTTVRPASPPPSAVQPQQRPVQQPPAMQQRPAQQPPAVQPRPVQQPVQQQRPPAVQQQPPAQQQQQKKKTPEEEKRRQ
ncbi:MAG: DUF6600 domain-containing protein [Syntrophobacteraceae bacterium]